MSAPCKLCLTNIAGSNPVLHTVGAYYGVFKLLSDPPHWSVDGR